MRMLGKAGSRRVSVAIGTGRPRRCECPECEIAPPPKIQRAREKRAWRREVES